jgi:hypothetical protein
MTAPKQFATTVSAKGQVIQRKAASAFPPTTVDQVFAMLKSDGPAHTIEEMDAAVVAEARRRARD